MPALELRTAPVLIGDTVAELEEQISSAASTDAKVLITGETGVGKEVVARLIHARSQRAAAQLITLNCAGMPDSLIESELFGHARGSFTGAFRDKQGLLELGHRGTVFLDEVGEMSARMQVVLLRFLETGEIQPIGADRACRRVDVRLITATSRDLSKQIAVGAFREDLYFRLNVIRIAVPALRERAGDISALVAHFLRVYSERHGLPQPHITPAAMDVLVGYRWPGNVRELKNVIERVVLGRARGVVTPVDLPQEVVRPARTPSAPTSADGAGTAMTSAEAFATRMLVDGESFWSAVYPAFMARDLTRADIRRLVRIGLERTNGNYRSVVGLFNMPPDDYKRFLSFLRKHDCHLPFHGFRSQGHGKTAA